MSRFIWTPQLEVGFPEMDHQHQGLIALMDRLDQEILQDASRAECLATLDELGERSVAHFAEEEALMSHVHFPRADQHLILHRTLLDKYYEYSDEMHSPTGRLTPQFMDFLNNWLTRHISGPDTQYGVFSGQLTTRG